MMFHLVTCIIVCNIVTVSQTPARKKSKTQVLPVTGLREQYQKNKKGKLGLGHAQQGPSANGEDELMDGGLNLFGGLPDEEESQWQPLPTSLKTVSTPSKMGDSNASKVTTVSQHVLLSSQEIAYYSNLSLLANQNYT